MSVKVGTWGAWGTEVTEVEGIGIVYIAQGFVDFSHQIILPFLFESMEMSKEILVFVFTKLNLQK